MRKLGQTIVLFLVITAPVAACRKSNKGSAVKTLTAQELESCKFEGRRYLVIVAPDFVGDVNAIQKLLVRSHSEAQLFQKSAIRANPELAKNPECLKYYESEASKYEEFALIQGPNATFANMKDKLAALKKRINNEYRAPLKRDGKEQGAVQVVITFTGHGSNNDVAYPDGSLIFAGVGASGSKVAVPGAVPSGKAAPAAIEAVRMRDVMLTIYDNLFSKCGIDCENPDERIADEVITFVDSCYSGIFGESAKQILSEKAYDLDIKANATSKATRFLSLSAADRGQVATGGLTPTGQGTLYQMLGEVIEYFAADLEPAGDGDGKITLAEFWKYIEQTSYMRFAPGATAAWEKLASIGICESVDGRKSFAATMLAGKTFLDKAFADPVNGLFDDTNGAGNGGAVGFTVQRPTMYSNMSQELLAASILAVRDPGAPANAQAQQVIKGLTDKTAKDEQIAKLKASVQLVQVIANHFAGKPSVEGKIPAKDLIFPPGDPSIQALFEKIDQACPPGAGAPIPGGSPGGTGAPGTPVPAEIPPSGP